MMVGVSISDEQLGLIADRAISDAGCAGEESICFEDLQKVSHLLHKRVGFHLLGRSGPIGSRTSL